MNEHTNLNLRRIRKRVFLKCETFSFRTRSFLEVKNGRVFFNRLYKNIYILFQWVSIKYLNTSRKYEGNMSLGGRQCMKLQNEILWSYKNMFCYLCLMVAKLCLQFEHCFEADYCIVKGNYYFRLSF